MKNLKLNVTELSIEEQKNIDGGTSIGRAIGYYVTEFFNTLLGNKSEDSEYGRH